MRRNKATTINNQQVRQIPTSNSFLLSDVSDSTETMAWMAGWMITTVSPVGPRGGYARIDVPLDAGRGKKVTTQVE